MEQSGEISIILHLVRMIYHDHDNSLIIYLKNIKTFDFDSFPHTGRQNYIKNIPSVNICSNRPNFTLILSFHQSKICCNFL
jgi:hypothetical protein